MNVITCRRGRWTGATAVAPTRHLLWAGVGLVVVLAGCSSAAARHQRTGPPAPPRAYVAGEDTVVVGYDSYSRKLTTGAVGAMVVADDWRRPQVNRIEDLLTGRIAGVVVDRAHDGSPSIRVRGVGAFRNSEPLLVVDGVPLQADVPLRSLLSGINPNDVMRIDVLKDASSAAIYGSRAGNGVVLITLRHPNR
jgi:TonB-dependent SusC/RagA subfamily outer membrane receptor